MTVDDRHVGHEARKLGEFRPAQHVADEEGVPRIFAEDADIDARGGRGAAIEILRVEALAARVLQHVGLEEGEGLRRHGLGVVPPDLVFGGLVADDELVLRRAARVDAGDGGERAMRGHVGLAVGDRGLEEPRLSPVPVDLGEVLEPEPIRSLRRVASSVFFHSIHPCRYSVIRVTGGACRHRR